MSLDDLNKELYNANASNNLSTRRHEQSQYDPKVGVQATISPFDQQQRWNAPQKGLTPNQKRKLWIFLSIFLLICLLIGGFFFNKWWAKNAFHQDRVSISFEGPKEADSTQLTKYIIHYKNNNRVTLKNAEIRLHYSENFQPTDNLNLKYLSPSSSKIFIGDIKSMAEGQSELKGIFYAPKDFPVYLRGEIYFTPSNGETELSMNNQIGVNITAAPVFFDIVAPKIAVSGDSLDYVIDYKNLDIKSIANTQIRIDFPQGFEFVSAQPAPSEKSSYWYIGNLEANQGGKIIVHGQISGNKEEGKNIVASLGYMGTDNEFVVYNKKELTTRIMAPVLTVMHKLEGKSENVVEAGESLRYSVTYQNTGTLGLRDAIITTEIKGDILDFSKINVENGYYDGKTNLITWKASGVPGLASIAPNATGSVYFSVPVKNIIPVATKLDKNFIISSVAKIDSPDIPAEVDSNKIVGSNRLDLKLASKVLFETKGFYNDTKMKNSGPIPMETGKETTFSLHWSVASVSNDLTGAMIISSLPLGVRWIGQIFPSDEKISYNERTNQLTWDVGNVSAGSGVMSPLREVEFQVGVTPQTNQVGESIVLLKKSIFTATDDFVGRELTLSSDQKDTQLYEDQAVGFANGKVVK